MIHNMDSFPIMKTDMKCLSSWQQLPMYFTWVFFLWLLELGSISGIYFGFGSCFQNT